MSTPFHKNRLDQTFGTHPSSSMVCSDDICRLPQLAARFGLRTDEASATQGAVIELATGQGTQPRRWIRGSLGI
jgi:hypothetical protein